DNIVANTAGGFNLKDQVFITKYPCGTAIMQLPFWLVAHILSPDKDGFSFFYRTAINIAAAFYLCAGLMLSYLAFRKFLTTFRAIMVCAFMLFATNLFYYGIFETGMSHIYSFAIISALYYMIICKWNEHSGFTIRDYVILGLLLGMIFLIRHINLIFIIPFLGIGTKSFHELKFRFCHYFFSKRSIIFYSTLLLVILPKFAYTYYLHVHQLSSSYKGESFNYLFQPKILEVLFAPKNGAILFSPFLLICLYFLFKLYRTNQWTFWIITGCFSMITYTYASWWSYELGCGLGHRGFVEFYPFLFLPIALFYQSKSFPVILFVLFLICAVYTTKNAYSYDGCFYGIQDWDWNEHLRFIRSPIK
ncbi:MAG: hypothetical protein H7259_02145, partial [Cytophagales bacterium]|nr:hypothetical protein [Cytophaga sp.]